MVNYGVALRMKAIFWDKSASVNTTLQPLVCPSQSKGCGLGSQVVSSPSLLHCNKAIISHFAAGWAINGVAIILKTFLFKSDISTYCRASV